MAYQQMQSFQNPLTMSGSSPQGYQPMKPFQSGLGMGSNSPMNLDSFKGSNPQGDPSFMDRMMDYENANGDQVQGWGIPALQGINGLAQSWLGFQNLGLAKDQFSFQKDSFTKQFDNQTQLTNDQRMAQWSALNDSAPGHYGAPPVNLENFNGQQQQPQQMQYQPQQQQMPQGNPNGQQSGYQSVSNMRPRSGGGY
jgi:hypothetical protein